MLCMNFVINYIMYNICNKLSTTIYPTLQILKDRITLDLRQVNCDMLLAVDESVCISAIECIE